MPSGVRNASAFDASQFEAYTVRRGDTLDVIARRLGVSSAEIRRPDGTRVHDADRDLILVRERLYVPRAPGRAPAALDAAASPATASTRPATAGRATRAAPLRLTFSQRPGEGTPATFGPAYDALRALARAEEKDPGRQTVRPLLGSLLPTGTPSGRYQVKLATLGYLADAAARVGYPLTPAGVARLQQDATIGDEVGMGPKTALALAARVMLREPPVVPAAANDWDRVVMPTERPLPVLASASRRDVPRLDVRTRQILGHDAIDTVNSTRYDALIIEMAALNGLDPALVKAVVCRESEFNRRATSRAGARGLMQLIGETAVAMGLSGDRYDARENLRAGCRFLRQLIDRFDGDVVKALAGYNAGPNAVSRALRGYPETRNYVQDVFIFYDHYKATGQPSA